MLTPKYLTKEIAEKSVAAVLSMVMEGKAIRPLLRRSHAHIVVLVPGMKDDRKSNYADWPDYEIHPVVLYEQSVGNQKDWERPYDAIARSKALQLWQGRNDDGTTVIPHLLFPGDTQFWGGVKRKGIVVTCSGLQAWFDKMISGLVADVLVALAHNDFEGDEKRKSGMGFLE